MKDSLRLCGRLLSPRHILFPLFLLFISSTVVHAKTIVIGNGSGFLSVKNMSGLNPGDVLAINPGTYRGAAFSSLKGITITNNKGTVIFNGMVTLNTMVECVFTDLQFINVSGISIRWDGNSRRCVERNISFTDCDGSVNDASDHNPYNGDTSSLKLYMCTFDSLTLYRSGMVMMGGWGEAKDLVCFMDSIIFSRIKIDSTVTNGSEVRGIFFRLDAHDWRVIYKGLNTGGGDIGMFQMNGDGKIHNIYRFGGRGYIVRIWNVGLKKTGNFYYYNNIDLNSTQYGSLDTRVDPIEFTKYTTGGNCYIFNNTAGNKEDHIGYWSSIAVVGTYAPPFICQTRNNLGFNLQTHAKPKITMNQSSNTWISDSSNNMYYDSPAGVVDPITCIPVDNSPVIGKGLTLSLFKNDIYYNQRIGAYDIGAVQHGGTPVPPPPNEPPVALTSATQTIMLPASNTILDGSKSYDPDGSISSYTWTLVNSTGGTIATPNTASTKISGLTEGTYVYKLTVKDNNDSTEFALDTIIVIPAGNLPPVANAGADQTITIPLDSIQVDGSSSRDQDNGGLISVYAWTQSSGPSTAEISTPSEATSSISGLKPGFYTFKLTVTDSGGLKASDSLSVLVKDSVSNVPDSNRSPIAIAGNSLTILLPTNTAVLDGSKSNDPDGTISSYSWTKISGPNDPALTGDQTASLSIAGLVAGQYNYQLEVTDDKSAKATAKVKITVVPAPNVAPIANAGLDQTITAPESTVSLDGTDSYDPDGSITSYNWTRVSGDATAVISDGNTDMPSLSALLPGSYTFRLTTTDNNGTKASDDVVITVNPEPTLPNQQPIANAGTTIEITTPASIVALNGSSSFDPDGTIVNYGWNEVSGPTTAIIGGNGSAQPTISALIVGTYVFQLTVTDNNGSTNSDQVTVNIKQGVTKINKMPVAIAGSDTTIFLPADRYLLNASASYDPDGNIAGYQWQQVSGPNTAVASSMIGADVDVSNLTEGAYRFQLTVTDNDGGQSNAVVNVNVTKSGSSSDALTVFPNPAHDIINTKMNSPVNGTVRLIVYDASGRSVMTEQTEKSIDVFQKTLNISSLSAGMYTIQVNISNRKTMVAKFVKY